MPYLENGLGGDARKHDPQLKNVLLLGDSIRLGYAPHCRTALQGVCNVEDPPDNGRTVQYTYLMLHNWSYLFGSDESVDLIYFNNGHWDVAHFHGDKKPVSTVSQYCAMLRRLVYQLRKDHPRAHLVFATTTPMNPDGSNSPNPRDNAAIARYNEAAKQVMAALDVPVDDLYGYLIDAPSTAYADYCHLTEAGFADLGRHVAASICRELGL